MLGKETSMKTRRSGLAGKLVLSLTNTVILGSESHGVDDLILL
jgi:hypothetical protein